MLRLGKPKLPAPQPSCETSTLERWRILYSGSLQVMSICLELSSVRVCIRGSLFIANSHMTVWLNREPLVGAICWRGLATVHQKQKIEARDVPHTCVYMRASYMRLSIDQSSKSCMHSCMYVYALQNAPTNRVECKSHIRPLLPQRVIEWPSCFPSATTSSQA